MAYIGKIKVTKTWAKVEDLIKAQIEGQSAFAFDNSKTYQIQGQSDFGIHLCEAATAPADENDGFVIKGTQCGMYKKGTNDLFVSTSVEDNINDYVKISAVGE